MGGEKRGNGGQYAPARVATPPRGEKRGDGDAYAPAPVAAPPWEEKRGDGDRYAQAAPYVDPGGRQRPEVNGTLCGSDRSRVRISDRRSYCSNRDRFKKSINDKTLVMGPVSPNENRNPN